MAKFGKQSKANLATCHPDLVIICETAIRFFDFKVTCGYRGQVDQDAAFNSGKSKLRFPVSKHNRKPSDAVDLAPYPLDWNDHARFIYLAGHVLGIARMLYEMGSIKRVLRYGGDFNQNTVLSDETFIDLPHFELVKPRA